MRSGLKAGSRFLFMMDEVAYILYICSAIRPFFLDKNKKNEGSRSCAKSTPFRVYILRHDFNSPG